jgi:hypothetical protein
MMPEFVTPVRRVRLVPARFLTNTGVVLALMAAFAWPMLGCSDPQGLTATEKCDLSTEEGEGGGTAFAPRGSYRAPLKKNLAVFQRRRIASDELPQEECAVIYALELANDSELSDPPGKPLVEESKRAATGLPGGRSVFVFPTTRGGSCNVVTGPGGSYECGNGSNLPGLKYWNPKPGRPYVMALVPNELVAVRVKTPTASYRVHVRGNVFFLQLPAEVKSVFDMRVVGVYEDGTTQRLG